MIPLRSLACTLALVAACRHPPEEPPVVPSDMRWVTGDDDPLQWRARGFIELTPTIRAPTTEDGTAHIVVMLSVPPGERIVAGRMPIGTTAARVEYAGPAHAPDVPIDSSWRVLDVRQFDWTASGIDCTVLRPDGDGRLVGLRWSCGEAADARAGELLARFLREGYFAAPRRDEARARAAHRIQLVNDCRGCHAFDRAEDRSATALVQRGTDVEGLFSIRSVFRDEDPVERYRPVDSNAGDPAMIPVCPGSEIDVRAARCGDGMRPRLRLDVRQSLREGAPHAAALCASRRALARWLDPGARASVTESLAACDAT